MNTHRYTRQTGVSRERQGRRHSQEVEPLAHLATQAGIRLRMGGKWLSRYLARVIWLRGRGNQVDRSEGVQLNPVAMRRAPGHGS